MRATSPQANLSNMKNSKQFWLIWALTQVGSKLCFAINWLTIEAGKIGSYAVLVITLLVTIDVAMRFLLGSGTMVAAEFSSYLLVLMVFFGIAYTLKEKRHITVDLVVRMLPSKVRDWLHVITSVMFLIYTIILSFSTWSFFLASYKGKTTSLTALDVEVWPYQLFMPLGSALISLLLICNIYAEIRNNIRGEGIEIRK